MVDKTFENYGDEFAAIYHHKRVRVVGNHFTHLGGYEGIVTAALYKYQGDEDTTILAIMADGYGPGTPEKWWTLEIAPGDLEIALADIEILA